MRTVTETCTTKLTVACYYRMSSEQQDRSIEQQRKECRKLAGSNGWTIYNEYHDDGKSGSKDQEERTDFWRMIEDAERGLFNAVVVWDTSRFGRTNSMDNEAARRLMAAGVHLETVNDGRIDWTTAMGRMMYAMQAEKNHEYSTNLSANTVRGRHDTIQDGYWPFGSVPFGYDRQYIYEGAVVALVTRTEDRGGKARGWRLKLVKNEAEAAIVEWVFEEYVERDTSARQIGRQLTARGIATPGNGKGGWTKDTVIDLLNNPAYIGVCHPGHNRRYRSATAFNRMNNDRKEAACPALISKALWEAANKKLQLRMAQHRHVRTTLHTSPLSRIIVCGKCGYRMDYKTRTRKSGQVDRYFSCSSATRRPKCGCKQWRAHEHDLWETVRAELVKGVDFEILAKINAQPETKEPAELIGLKKEAEKWRAKIKKGQANLLQIDTEEFAGAQALLREWRAELHKIENTIALAECDADKNEIAQFLKWWEGEKSKLVVVSRAKRGGVEEGPMNPGEALAMNALTLPPDPMIDGEDSHGALVADVQTVRGLLHRLNTTLTLWWTPNGQRYYTLDKGILKADFTNEHLVGGGNATPAPPTNTSASPPASTSKPKSSSSTTPPNSSAPPS